MKLHEYHISRLLFDLHSVFKLKFCFSQKLFGYAKPNIIRKLLRILEEKNTTGLGHMTKMVAMPIYSKTFKNLLQNQLNDGP